MNKDVSKDILRFAIEHLETQKALIDERLAQARAMLQATNRKGPGRPSSAFLLAPEPIEPIKRPYVRKAPVAAKKSAPVLKVKLPTAVKAEKVFDVVKSRRMKARYKAWGGLRRPTVPAKKTVAKKQKAIAAAQ